jgi:hypothetical protein
MATGFNPMILSAQYSEVPDELQSSRRAKPIPLSVKTVAVPTQSGAATSGSQLLFQLNSATGFIKPASMYLKARITLTTTGGNAAAFGCVAWGNSCRNASSIIDRFTVSSGAVLESINNYGSVYIPTLLLHCSNQTYLESDDGMLEGGKRLAAAAAGNNGAAAGNSALYNRWVDIPNGSATNFNTYVDVAIPMYSNLFCNEKSYPIALLAQNTLIQLDLATFGKAMTVSSGVATEYTVSSAQLVYDLITPSPEYLMMLKQELAQGQLYQVPFVSTLASQFAKSGQSTTYNWGVGLSSLKGITYSCVTDQTVVTSLKSLFSDNAVNGAGANFRLFLDGQQQNSVMQDTSAVRYAQMTSVFGLLTDVNRTTGAGAEITIADGATAYSRNPTTYEANYFVGGQGCAKVNESLAMTGSQVNNVSMIVETSGSTANSVIVCNAWHDRILVIDGAGSASIIL